MGLCSRSASSGVVEREQRPKYIFLHRDGDVGIGTASPDNAKLHVHGNSVVGDASVSAATSFMEVRGYGAVGKLKAHGHGVSTSGATIADSIMLEAEASAAQGLVLATAHSTAPMRFYTNSGLRMTIASSGDVTFTGKISATSKSFLIDHPTKENKKLQYASLEGPENGVYVRGKLEGDVIELPDCLLYTSPSPRDMWTSRMPSSA